MAGKMKKIILRTLAGIIIFILLIVAAAYMFLNFYFIPKYNEALGDDAAQSEQLTQKDLWDITKNLANKQAIENIVSFDKNSAKDLLSAAKEIEADITSEDSPAPKKSDFGKNAWSKKVIARAEAIPTPTPTPTPTPVAPKPTAVPKKSQVKGATAYERIMNTATKEEIRVGSAILAKVNMGKVNQLRSQGKMGELKKYIKSVLTSAEISKALQLYGKYRHLL